MCHSCTYFSPLCFVSMVVVVCVFFSVQVWDARSHQLLQHYPAHDGEVTSISFHHSGNFLLSSSTDASLKVRLDETRQVSCFFFLPLISLYRAFNNPAARKEGGG